MQPYSQYKKSGVTWIGEIPVTWNFAKLKHYSTSKTGSTPSRLNKDYWDNGTVPWMSSGEIHQKTVYRIDQRITEKALAETSVEIFPVNTLMFAMNGQGKTKGSVGLLKTETTFNQSLTGFVLDSNLSSKYAFYYFDSKYYGLRGLVGEDREGLNSVILKNLYLPLPSFQEQEQITFYLDHKTNLIDTLIEKKQRLIDLLKEERTAVINEAVTKGLDPSAPMKDSGIEWLAEIPEHWLAVKFAHFIFLKHGYQFREYDFTKNGCKIIKITQLKTDGTLDLTHCSTIDENRSKEFEDIVVKEDDILMALTGGTIGKVVRATNLNDIYLQNYRVGNFTPTNPTNLIKTYIYWLVLSDCIYSQIIYSQRETGQPNIGKEDFRKIHFSLPPMNEQQKIADFLDQETTRIDTIITKAEKEIELLQEYRTALISEVVTGKIDVRNWKEPENDSHTHRRDV